MKHDEVRPLECNGSRRAADAAERVAIPRWLAQKRCLEDGDEILAGYPSKV
jgi:hypothetical protein